MDTHTCLLRNQSPQGAQVEDVRPQIGSFAAENLTRRAIPLLQKIEARALKDPERLKLPPDNYKSMDCNAHGCKAWNQGRAVLL